MEYHKNEEFDAFSKAIYASGITAIVLTGLTVTISILVIFIKAMLIEGNKLVGG